MLRMTRVGGSGTEQGKLARPRARTIVHAPRQRQRQILRDAQDDKSRRPRDGTRESCQTSRTRAEDANALRASAQCTRSTRTLFEQPWIYISQLPSSMGLMVIFGSCVVWQLQLLDSDTCQT